MDADVSDSPGTPAEPDRPDHPAGGEPAEGSGDASGPAPQDGTSAGPPDASATGDTAEEAGGTDDASGPGGSGDGPAPGTWGERPGRGPQDGRRHWLRWTALAASFLVLVAAGVGWWLYKKLDGNITTDTSAAAELKAYEKDRPQPIARNAQNILLIGSDTRSGDNSAYGRDDGGSQRSDTTILLHLAADRGSATAVSIPRDLMTRIPSCHTDEGKATEEQFAQFNWAFELGGTACTIRTVEKMTGVRVDHHMVVDFNGFKDMVDAVDGVEVCLKEPVDDADAHLKLPAGRQELDGEDALGYVRARKSIGNGSDTERMDRQQKFLGALVNKMQSNGVLLNPTRLYPVLDAATKSLTTDPGLDSLRDLYDLVRGMRNVPTEKVQFLTVPRTEYRADPNRDELVQPDANQLFTRLRKDEPVAVVPADKAGSADSQADHSSEKDPSGREPGGTSGSPTPAPTYSGSNAADDPCGS
ncbi:LCP family protein [Streptomyces sp. JH34]|uniref:LCP family protein n=1 Tax=Streptomyces sp. JH34 TaxID=2793633 RepID=UPI0023FA02E1|nr:LCP family protein [Streptomyces sp. JH34]MDF6020641.1 LCP family protein [Streptomyces sp. JH34]